MSGSLTNHYRAQSRRVSGHTLIKWNVMLCLADCSLVQVCLAQSSIQCSGSSFQFGQFIHPWLVCLPLQCTSPCSGSSQVGNFPTDIETSSLPSCVPRLLSDPPLKCSPQYQKRQKAAVRRSICCLQGDRVAASYGNSGTKHLSCGSWWFQFNTKIHHFHPDAIPLPAGAGLIPSWAFALHTVY